MREKPFCCGQRWAHHAHATWMVDDNNNEFAHHSLHCDSASKNSIFSVYYVYDCHGVVAFGCDEAYKNACLYNVDHITVELRPSMWHAKHVVKCPRTDGIALQKWDMYLRAADLSTSNKETRSTDIMSSYHLLPLFSTFVEMKLLQFFLNKVTVEGHRPWRTIDTSGWLSLVDMCLYLFEKRYTHGVLLSQHQRPSHVKVTLPRHIIFYIVIDNFVSIIPKLACRFRSFLLAHVNPIVCVE